MLRRSKWCEKEQEKEASVVSNCVECSSEIIQASTFVRTEHDCNGAGTGVCNFHKRCWFKKFRKRFNEVCFDCGLKLDTVITIDSNKIEHHHNVK